MEITKDIVIVTLIISGLLLILLDVAITTLFLFPVGVGLVMGALSYALSPSLVPFSIGFLIGFGIALVVSYLIAKKVKGTKSALESLIGQEGVVIDMKDDFTYTVRFPLGVGGEEIWNAYSGEELSYGDRVVVKDVVGNKVIVKKCPSK